MLDTLNSLAGIAGLLIVIGQLAYAGYRRSKIRRRALRPADDDVSQLEARLAAVEAASERFGTVERFQVHQIHRLAVAGVALLMTSSILIVLVIFTLSPTDWTRVFGAFTALGSIAAIGWLGTTMLRTFEAGVLVAGDFQQVKSLEAHLEAKKDLRRVQETQPLR